MEKNFVKVEAEGQEFAKTLRSLEQLFSNSERSEQFSVTECFFPGGFSDVIIYNN